MLGNMHDGAEGIHNWDRLMRMIMVIINRNA